MALASSCHGSPPETPLGAVPCGGRPRDHERTGRGGPVKIRVDRSMCQGHAMCNMAAPDVYLLDDLGYNALHGEIEVAEALAEQAHRGALVCPERAITIIEDSAAF